MAFYPCLSLPSLSFPSVSGSICTFKSQYAGLPLKSHKIALTATQSGSGTPSPDNVRPISGWSAITITANSVPTVISIGSTIYGGEYDARTGVLRVTTRSVDMGSLSWGKSTVGDYTVFYATPEPYKNNNTENMLCSIYSVVDKIRTQLLDGEMGLYNTNNEANWRRITVRDDSRSNLTGNEFATVVSGQTVIYKLETPTTIQLPPCPIETQLVNNIFADTGDTTLQYPKFG